MAHRSALINVMAGAARKAARGLNHDFGEVEQLQVSRKGPADFVSTADRRAERVLIEELKRARPRYGVLSEESGAQAGADTSNRWIVDPLDGTLNFLHGNPHFCLSLALERDGEIFAGAVYDPLRDELFWAEKGAGAYLNDRRLRVSARQQLREAVLATGIRFMGEPERPRFLARLEAMMALSGGFRRFGAAALDLAYVAAGRYDGFWEAGLEPWDIAAGILLVSEAGGFVSALDGGAEMLESGDVVAANPHLHPLILSALDEVDAGEPGSAERLGAKA